MIRIIYKEARLHTTHEHEYEYLCWRWEWEYFGRIYLTHIVWARSMFTPIHRDLHVYKLFHTYMYLWHERANSLGFESIAGTTIQRNDRYESVYSNRTFHTCGLFQWYDNCVTIRDYLQKHGGIEENNISVLAAETKLRHCDGPEPSCAATTWVL